jgi:hypothetical protein
MTKYTDNDFPFFDEAEDLTVERSEIQNLPVEQWLAIRKEEALRINPDTALVRWEYRQVLDPYGVPRSAAGMRLRRARVFCAESRKRHLGVVL